MSNFLRTTICAFLLSGCTYANSEPMPYKSWYLGFSAPDYMEVWIETADVVDIQDHVYPRAMSGVASMLRPPNNSGDPRGWPKRAAIGSGSCDKLWAMGQEEAIRRLSKKRSSASSKYELISDFSARAARIAAAYASFYLEQGQDGKPELKGRFYWMGLAAFASKQVK